VSPLYKVAWLGKVIYGTSQDKGGGDSLQIWKVTEDILNNQSWTADKGRSSSLGVG
jgi:hypothetical protein